MASFIEVGQVFEVFPGSKGLNYYGIEVTGPFSRGAKLKLRPPGDDGSNDITLRVATIEIEKQRANVAHTGNKCAIRFSEPPETKPGPNWTVLVNSDHSESAKRCTQQLTPRPVKPPDTAGRKEFSVW